MREGSLSLDGVFEALSNERRRHVLWTLVDRDAPLAMSDLAEEVAARETEGRIDGIPIEYVRKLHVELYHWHVPRLGDLGLVRYHPARAIVEITDRASLVEPYLSAVADGETFAGTDQ